MSVRTLETDRWTVDLPEEWQAEQDEELVVIRDEDGVSCIEITTLENDGKAVSAAELAQLSAELRDRGLRPDSPSLPPWQGEYYQYSEDGESIREWYLRADDLLLFITCSCLAEHAGFDDSAVDAILATLLPLSAARTGGN